MKFKNLPFVIGLLFFTSSATLVSNNQSPEIKSGRSKKIPLPIPNVPSDLMITPEFFSPIGLTNSSTKDGRNVWSAADMDSVQQVFDIRWVFKSNKEALLFHRAKLMENSEGGQQIEDPIEIPGAQELHVYRESVKLESMITKMKLQTKHFCFLFVVENVVAKVYISVHSNLSINDITKIPQEAVKKISDYQKK